MLNLQTAEQQIRTKDFKMADHLSIAALYAGLLSLTLSFISITYKYGTAVKSSRNDVAAFSTELTSFPTLLERVEFLSSSGKVPASQLEQLATDFVNYQTTGHRRPTRIDPKVRKGIFTQEQGGIDDSEDLCGR